MSPLSTESSSTSLLTPPPDSMRSGDDADADGARRRLSSKSRPGLFSFVSRGRRQHSTHPADTDEAHSDSQPNSLFSTGSDRSNVFLNSGGVEDPVADDQDLYRWAMLYENQRGLTIFSTPYYSHLSLLPNDPPPFTVPSVTDVSKRQPTLTLEDYPLPDGNWRWVSKQWMIDMRGDGEVQHDGFEYNWFFRRGKWRPVIGPLSAGGWVRRRRWVRLMMRPAGALRASGDGGDGNAGSTVLSTRASPLPSASEGVAVHEDFTTVWRGDEGDWTRCHHVMKRLGRDGRQLEMWRQWLGDGDYVSVKAEKRQWTEDEQALPSEDAWANLRAKSVPAYHPPLKCISAVLRGHAQDIMQSFIYPASRAQLLALLAEVGIIEDMRVGLGSNLEVEFWSWTSGLADLLQETMDARSNSVVLPEEDSKQ